MKYILKFLLPMMISLNVYALDVSIESFAFVEITKTENGKEVKTLEEAKSVLPGQMVVFKNVVSNKSAKNVNDVVVVNEIPNGLIFSAPLVNNVNVDITYSIDRKLFSVPSKLMITDKTTNLERVARSDEYKVVKWTIKKELTNKEKFEVGYKAILK